MMELSRSSKSLRSWTGPMDDPSIGVWFCGRDLGLNDRTSLMSENFDSRERDETKEVRLETSDGPRGDSGAQFVVMAIMFITSIFFGVKMLNFVLLPVTTIIIMIAIVVFRL
ncbi:hypothetical protein K1719_010709 [Acacia pycnantha]|nr:hypothetical protein K1719_010709 [Acacia pycnantha]